MQNIAVSEEINESNKVFWDELCGTQLAETLGITDSSPESLLKFDNFYFDFYPYLKKYLFLDEVKGKNVLEVGLGYGTVSQALALAGAHYHGLDIAENPVGMAKHRLEQHGKTGQLHVDSMLTCPFPSDYFDYVISIGCFHHTGSFEACIEQTHRVLKKGGKATIMVYNKYSMRHWTQWPSTTARNLLRSRLGKNKFKSSEAQRKSYDLSSQGQGAPETEFFSIREIKKICQKFQSIHVTRENFDENTMIKVNDRELYKFESRALLLNSAWVKHFGLDLYIVLSK